MGGGGAGVERAVRVGLATAAVSRAWNRVLRRPRAGLPHPQLDQPGDPVLHHPPFLAELVKVLTLAPGAGCLQQCLLRMEQDHPPPGMSRIALEAVGPQRTGGAHLPGERECCLGHPDATLPSASATSATHWPSPSSRPTSLSS